MKKTLTVFSRVAVALCGLLMLASLALPVWQIRLEAPQYPEGLKMEIWAYKLAGDVTNINMMNHYIGMAHIDESNFPEFKVMPWLIVAMTVLSLLVAATGKRWMLWINSAYLVLCGIWGTYDFWHWEYQYGHNLDPHAAIKIPGMTYQPPLLGWKQLLNFVAGSFPDIGGWLIILPAVVIVSILFYESIRHRKQQRMGLTANKHNVKDYVQSAASVAVIICSLALGSCNAQPSPLAYGKDACDHCRMIIMDQKFGAELINTKGKIFKFDSGECMADYLKEHGKDKFATFLIVDYDKPGQLIDAQKAYYLLGGSVKSPMGGKLAAFQTKEAAEKANQEFGADIVLWEKVTSHNF